jgi:hypothetical protein
MREAKKRQDGEVRDCLDELPCRLCSRFADVWARLCGLRHQTLRLTYSMHATALTKPTRSFRGIFGAVALLNYATREPAAR